MRQTPARGNEGATSHPRKAGRPLHRAIGKAGVDRSDALDHVQPGTHENLVILQAFDQLKLKEPAPPVAAAKFTDATLAAGAIKAIYKDLPKTAVAVWGNKEIAVLLQQLGLPEDAALSVLVVEVFGNITNIFDHFFALSDEQLQALGNTTDSAKEIVTTLLDRRRRNRQALNEELGNYRILRTSPLTEVPFVCCPTCG